MNKEDCIIIIVVCCVLGMIWAAINAYLVSRVQPFQTNEQQQKLSADVKQLEQMEKIGNLISEGSDDFLFQEYKFLGVFLAVFSVVIYIAVDGQNHDHPWCPYTLITFVIGCATSVLSGFIGMRIATYANTRTAYQCTMNMTEGFRVAFRAGCVMGFFLVSIGLVILQILVICYQEGLGDMFMSTRPNVMYEYIAGYGLGGSTVALFGRVGGGIYTKAADVGADLVGKGEEGFNEDSPQNPATIADNVGDNVGDIAGMGADLFGSFAESTCAAMVIMSSYGNGGQDIKKEVSLALWQDGMAIYYPMMISALGIIVCIATSICASFLQKVEYETQAEQEKLGDKVESVLKWQLIISTLLMTPVIIGATYMMLPEQFYVDGLGLKSQWNAWVCCLCGLWSGLLIGYITEIMTSHSYSPVRELANSCTSGAATNIIFGLALGYLSTIVPVVALAITIFVSLKLLGMFGVALAALGMLSNLCIGLTIDAYGPISDNAGGIAEMSELGAIVRKRTDTLDAAGNTTAAIGKGFAIGSAALVSLALFGAFVTRAQMSTNVHRLTGELNILNPLLFSGLLVGAMLPYAFSAMTMKAVGIAASDMVKEIKQQLKENPGIRTGEVAPNYKSCIEVSTRASLQMMIGPGALVIITPILCGFLFGPQIIAGLLPGALVSGVQMAISMSNSGGAWDNAKKYVEGGMLIVNDEVRGKNTDEHRAAITGDTVGDPLKDTSGPSLNILIKLMAILSLVFCELFTKTAFLVCPLGMGSHAQECN